MLNRSSALRSTLVALFLLSLAFSALAAPVEILNTARIEYQNFDPGPTNSVFTPTVRTVVDNAPPAPPPTIRFFPTDTYNTPISTAVLGQRLFVRAQAEACATNPAVSETTVITLTSTLTGDSESFTAFELGTNTGFFIVLPFVPTTNAALSGVTPGNGIIETRENDTLTASVTCGATNSAAVNILIQPSGGVVFDSRSNLPIAGARVTLIDASSGLPAQVFNADGSAGPTNPVVTGPDGVYVFPFVNPGSYRLVVVPPPGYAGPSTVPLPDLPPGRRIANPGSLGGNFTMPLGTGQVLIDIPLDPAPANTAGLFIQKLGSRSVVEIGEFIDYTLNVKNVSGAAIADARITDWLPHGFAYRSKSSRFGGTQVPEPSGLDSSTLEWPIGPIADGATVTLTYRARVGVGAMQGNGVNKAQATDIATQRKSNIAEHKVRVDGGVFTDRAFIVGKVFVDANTNRIQDAGEVGVPGIRLWLQDGTYVITDNEGKYSFYGLRPRTHILKLDNITLPGGAKLEELSTRDAMSPGSRFIELRNSELHKADFAILPGSPEMMKEINKRRQEADKAAGELDSAYKSDLRREGESPVSSLDARNLPASGVVGQQGTPPRGNGPAASGFSPVNAKPPAAASSERDPSLLGPGATGTVANTFSPLLPPDTLNNDNSNVPFPGKDVARISADAGITNLNNTLGFVDLRHGDTLPMAQANVRVKGRITSKFSLQVNGAEVPKSRLGKQVYATMQQLEVWEFVGVTLRPGNNTLTVTQLDSFGNARGSQSIVVIAPDKLGRIQLVLPKFEQPADGKTPANITVLLTDAKGVPVTARTPLTLETSLGEWMVQDLNKVDPGTQVFIEGGKAEFKLKPPLEPGDAKIAVSSGTMSAQATVAFLPDMRPMVAAGIVEGVLNFNNLKSRGITPARSHDGFEEELRSWSLKSDDGKQQAGARASFFLKGKVLGQYLLTAAYDSDKDTKERLFRDIQPDEFYPIYGDSSTRGFDAQSTGRLFVRIDKQKCYLLYGDFNTTTASEARQLGNYSRSLTGIREHYEKNRLSLNVWASDDSTRQVIEEVRANGTSGPYFVGTANGIVNSEKVEIITRDRHQQSLVIKTEPLTRFADYEFEPFTGRILLRAPVPSLDANLNPNFIRVTYESEQGGDKFWTYGGDGQWKATPWLELGGSGARDENPRGEYGVYSANTTLRLAPKTFVIGEVARSDAAGTPGDAARVELRHSDATRDARLYYNWSEGSFSNAAATVSGGRVEAGAKFSQKVGPNTRIVGQGIISEQSGSGGGSRKGVTLGVEHTFTNQVRVEVGGRYSTETAIPASPSTSLPAGTTPNDVTSVRIKVTAPVPKVKGASVYGEYENDLVDTDKRMAALGGEYQLMQKTRLYGRYEFIDSIGGPYELNNFQQQNTAVFGLDTEYMKDGRLFNEYRMRDAISGREAEAATGLRNLWNVAEGVRLSTSFEHVAPVIGDNHQNEATAVTGGIEYTRNPNWKGTARLELRTAEANDSLLNTLSYARKINRDWAFLGRQILYLVDNKGPTDGSRMQGRWQAGFAWRQTQTDRWSALMRYEFKYETDSTQPALDVDRLVHILSLHANFQPHADWIFSGHYAGKYSTDNANGFSDSYDAHMLNFRATYEIHRRWDIGLNTSTLFSGKDGSIHYGLGPEVGFTVAKNLRLGVGYNFFGFNDRDLSQNEYTSRGVYVALRLKFDEALLNFATRKEGDK